MSAKPILIAMMLGTLMTSAASAQSPMTPAPVGGPMTGGLSAPPAMNGPAASVLAGGFTPLQGNTGPSWLNDGTPLPVGRDGPLSEELYSMMGLTLANGNGIFGQHLDGGFMMEGGFRLLSFNTTRDAAWTAKLGLTFQTNRSTGNVPTFDFFGMDARIRNLMRFSGVFALGRDWFLYGASPFGDGRGSMRAGFDLGTRWGTEKVDLDIINDPIDDSTYRHRSDNYGGVVLGWHAYVEVPMRAWTWVGGLRAEYGYNWSELLPGQNSNIHDVNLLFTTGFRY